MNIFSFAPLAFRAFEALHRVPAESAISSSNMHVLFSTLPIIFITSETPAFSLLLSAIANPALSLFANALARTTPPTSGEAITRLLFPANFLSHIFLLLEVQKIYYLKEYQKNLEFDPHVSPIVKNPISTSRGN